MTAQTPATTLAERARAAAAGHRELEAARRDEAERRRLEGRIAAIRRAFIVRFHVELQDTDITPLPQTGYGTPDYRVTVGELTFHTYLPVSGYDCGITLVMTAPCGHLMESSNVQTVTAVGLAEEELKALRYCDDCLQFDHAADGVA